jgi:hypothetical protein
MLMSMRQLRGKRALGLFLVVLGLSTVACSPEANRTRSGGQGADLGNRPSTLVEMHGQRNMFYQTPALAPALR